MSPANSSSAELSSWFAAATGWDTAIVPDYSGGSNANLIASIYNAFAIESSGLDLAVLPPVREELLPSELVADARVLLFIVLDGLGQPRLQTGSRNGDLPGLASSHFAGRLTSVFPPTTVAALTSLQTGVAPARHGFTGYTMFLPEEDRVYNMITWKPVGGANGDGDSPAPSIPIPVPNMYQPLQRAGVNTRIVTSAAFEDSPLTRTHASGVKFAGYRTLSEFTHLLLRYCRRPGRWFVFGYWDGFDLVSHIAGPDSLLAHTELRLIDTALEMGVLEPLRSLGQDVAVIVTADHGHTAIPLAQRRLISKMHSIGDSYLRRPTGEPRLMGLSFADPPPVNRLQRELGDDGVALRTADAVQAGLYGPGSAHPQLEQRIGDRLLIARGNTAFDYPDFNNRSLGGHGSLTAPEMLVPLLVWRFR